VHRCTQSKIRTKAPANHMFGTLAHARTLIHLPSSTAVVSALPTAFESLCCIPGRASPWRAPRILGIVFEDSRSYASRRTKFAPVKSLDSSELFSEFLRILLRIPTSSATIIKAISKVVSQDMTRRTHHKLSADEIDASELTLMLERF